MISKTIKIGLFAITMASFSLIGAQEKVQIKVDRAERMFQHLDMNADNAITLDEFKTKRLKDDSNAAQIEKQFNKMDSDENGTLNRKEYRVAYEARGKTNLIKKQKTIEKNR